MEANTQQTFEKWLEENCWESTGYWFFKKDGKMSIDECPHYKLEELKEIFTELNNTQIK